MKNIDILLEVCNYLLDNGIIKNQKEFGEIIGETNKFGWTDLKADRKKVSLSHLQAIASRFKEFNRNFLFMGEGTLTGKTDLDENPLIDDYINNLKENNKLLKEKVVNLESELKKRTK